MSIGISQLVAEIGDENIKLQNLDTCLTSANYSAKKRNCNQLRNGSTGEN